MMLLANVPLASVLLAANMPLAEIVILADRVLVGMMLVMRFGGFSLACSRGPIG